MPEGLHPNEVIRVRVQARRYFWDGITMHRNMPGDKTRVVPPPQDRASLVIKAHDGLGHFGVTRTVAALQTDYYWCTLRQEVKTYIKGCEPCDKVRAAFTQRERQLHPLVIRGLFFRWNVDLAGELPKTRRGNKYVLIMVEHFSKWIELIPIPDRQSETIARAFLVHVLCRFGAPAEVVSDGGT